MTDREYHSLTAHVFWKVLNYLPRRKREPGLKPADLPRPPPRQLEHDRDQQRYTVPKLEFHCLALRKHSLSQSSSYHDGDVKQPLHTESQTASLLFKLPKEVRLLIYEQLLGGMVLHIIRRREKLGHRLCCTRGSLEQCAFDHCRGFKVQSGFHTGRGDGQILQILQSCRKVYSEAVDILYSKNVFDFDSLEGFISFSCAVLPQRLDRIRKLQLDFGFHVSLLYTEDTPYTNWARWERTWRIIANMVALQEIRMRITWPKLSKCGKNSLLKILKPMELVTGLIVFELTVPALSNVSISWLEETDSIPFRFVKSWTKALPESEPVA